MKILIAFFSLNDQQIPILTNNFSGKVAEEEKQTEGFHFCLDSKKYIFCTEYSALPDESKLEESFYVFFQSLFFFFQVLEMYPEMQQFVF